MNEITISIDQSTMTIEDWSNISSISCLPKDFIRKYKDQLDWAVLSRNKGLPEDLIREFQDKIDWSRISVHQILSDEFIEEFKDKISFSRPNIIFTRDIEPLHPCASVAKKYLSIWNKDQEITWNELIEKYDDKGDIWWLYSHIKNGKN